MDTTPKIFFDVTVEDEKGRFIPSFRIATDEQIKQEEEALEAYRLEEWEKFREESLAFPDAP